MSFSMSWCRARSAGKIAVLFLGLTILGACAAPTPTSEPVTVSFAFPSSEIVHYSELIARFHEQYPHIRIQRRPQRGRQDVEKPVGQWNRLECIAEGQEITIVLNGAVVNHAIDVRPRKGRIQVQSEGAEVLFRRIDLVPLRAKPAAKP